MAHLVLYDGVCGLCNWAVRVVLKHDPNGEFTFASIQSEYGAAVLSQNGYTSDSLDSFVLLIDHGQPTELFLNKSEAALYVAKLLGGWWRLLTVFRIVPRSVRDWLYRIVARNRYRWFGMYDSCPMPDARYRDRFLDE